MVPRQNVYHRPALPATLRTTQAGLVSLTLFNIIVDNVIQTWLAMTVEYQRMAHGGLREALWRCLRVFYADDGMVVSRDPDWLQHSMNGLVGLFRRFDLEANIAKSRLMTCQPGALRSIFP